MSTPTISSYKDALRTPEHSLQKLSYLQPVPGVHDDFYFSSGNFAVVFKMKDKMDGRLKALKCFTRDQEQRRESLHLISNYLNQIQSEYIIPYTFLEDEIWADGADHPVLLMDWIQGETLGEHVSKLCECHDRYGLERLCQGFARLSLWLLDQPWAHGDLKHDNILVWFDDSLVLIDYDGCFIPDMEGQNAREIGSPSFRHPMRSIKDFDPHLDDFSILVIFLSLRILSAEPALRQEQQDGENLVLSIRDISAPATSTLLERFRQHSDSFLKAGIALLDMAVSFPAGQIFGLREVLKKWLDEEMAVEAKAPPHMVYVRGGTFEMGEEYKKYTELLLSFLDDYVDDDISCVTKVNDFLFAKNELTFEEFDRFCLATNKVFPDDKGLGRGKLPVVNVDWYDAIEYCNWLSDQENLQKVYNIDKNIKDPNNTCFYDNKKWLVFINLDSSGYRLPTEAEWEYTARLHIHSLNPETEESDSGSNSGIKFNCAKRHFYEWCSDWHKKYYSGDTRYSSDTSSNDNRVIRGGSNHFTPRSRVVMRFVAGPSMHSSTIGFRLVRTVTILLLFSVFPYVLHCFKQFCFVVF